MRWGDFHVSLYPCWSTQGSHLVSLAVKTGDGTAEGWARRLTGLVVELSGAGGDIALVPDAGST
jgi:hypothetical protein